MPFKSVARGMYRLRVPKVLRAARSRAQGRAAKVVTLRRQLNRADIAFQEAVARVRAIEENVSFLRRNPFMRENPILSGIGGGLKRALTGSARSLYDWRVPEDIRYTRAQITSTADGIRKLTAAARVADAKWHRTGDPNAQQQAIEYGRRVEEAKERLEDLKVALGALDDQTSRWKRPSVFWNNPGGDTMGESVDISGPGVTISNVRPVNQKEQFVMIPDADGNDPSWHDVQNQLTNISRHDRGRLINYNPGNAWLAFLSNWRRTHPKAHTLKENQDLLRAAAVEYHTHHNPGIPGIDIVPPRAFGQKGQVATILISGLALAALGAWNKWKGGLTRFGI